MSENSTTETPSPTGTTNEPTQITRLSVNINEDTAAKLRWYKERKGISITETVRRAVALLELVERETVKGNQVLLKSSDGKSIRELWLV